MGAVPLDAVSPPAAQVESERDAFIEKAREAVRMQRKDRAILCLKMKR